jgi:GT2 family glycosyltransferase
MLYLLIPVFKESTTIKECVEYFHQFIRYPKVHVYYITTEREGVSGKTANILKKLRKQYSFHWMHCPKKRGFKSHQLNWAIKKIKTAIDEESQRTYFGIYDVDSRPDPLGLEKVLYGRDPVYQQPSIYLENYSRISLFQQAGALLQTKWEFCRNVPVLREQIKQKTSASRLQSCTGHGLFIRSDIFNKVGIFSTNTLTEDLEFGYRLAFYGIHITPLKEGDLAKYSPTFFSSIYQTSRWFGGEFLLFRYYQEVKQKSWQLTLLVIKRYYTTFKWAFAALLVLLAFVKIWFLAPLISIFLLLLSMYLYVYKPFQLLKSFPGWENYFKNTKVSFSLFILGYVRPLLNSLGPFHYLFFAPINYLRTSETTFVRTPKN